MAAATFDLRPIVSKKEWAIQGKLDIGVENVFLFYTKYAFPRNCRTVEALPGGLGGSEQPWQHLVRRSHTFTFSPGGGSVPYCCLSLVKNLLVNIFEPPGNTSSDAPTLSLSHQEEKCEREIGQVEEGRMRRREFFDLSPQSGKLQKSLATTLLVSKLVDAMVGLVLVLVETIAWMVAWRTNQSSPSSVPIFLLLPTPLSSFLWLATRYRTKNPGQVVFR